VFLGRDGCCKIGSLKRMSQRACAPGKARHLPREGRVWKKHRDRVWPGAVHLRVLRLLDMQIINILSVVAAAVAVVAACSILHT